MPNRIPRRRFLAVAGATALLAGCADGAAEPSSEAGPGERDRSTASPPGETDGSDGAERMATPPPPETVDARVELFVSRLARRQYDWAAGMFDGALAGMDEGRLAATWVGLTTQHGPYAGATVRGRELRDELALRVLELQFETDSQTLQLVVDRYAKIVGVDFPTAPSTPAYETGDAREFGVDLARVDDAGCSLRGTVTLPPGESAVPGVVVVHRTGPHDRDGSVGPNRPYRDLAVGLAAHGVASLRYDKRTARCDLPKAEQTLSNIVVADAVTAVERLRAEPRVDRVVVFGHGIGGVAAPLVADRIDVDGIVLAATPARPLTEVYLASERLKAQADGEVTDEERQRLAYVAEKLEQAETLGPDEEYYILGTATTYWRDLAAHDAVAATRTRPEPVLVVHPGRDFVATDADLERWEAALPAATVRRYPPLDHLLMPVFGRGLPEAYFFPDNVDAGLVADVAAWVSAGAVDSDGSRAQA